MKLDNHNAKRKFFKGNDVSPKTNLSDEPDTISLINVTSGFQVICFLQILSIQGGVNTLRKILDSLFWYEIETWTSDIPW